MKLDYANSKEQLRAFNTLACRRLAGRRGARAQLMARNIIAWIAIAFGTATLIGLYREVPGISSELNLAVVAFLLAVAVMVAGSVYQERLQANAVSAEDCWSRIQQSVSAGPDHLEITAAGVHTRYE